MKDVNEAKLNDLVGKMLNDLGGATSVALVRMGVGLELYKALYEDGPATSNELAERTGCAERYLREWLSHHAASGYLDYDAATGRFGMSPEQAAVFADEDSAVYLVPAFDIAKVMLDNQVSVEEAFRTGGGVGWGDQAPCLFCTTARFFRPGYLANIVQNWIPALDGVAAKLERGAKVADVGCGHGISTILMAEAFPNSEFVGYDFHPELHRGGAGRTPGTHATNGRVRFEVGLAKDYPGEDYDLVTFFDCLHDMGDPTGAAPSRPRDAEARWDLDDRRADGPRPPRGEPEPGRQDVLRRLDDDLRADLARAGGRGGARRAGRRGAAARGRDRRWLQPFAAGHRDAVQHDPGGPAVGNPAGWVRRIHPVQLPG